MMEMSDSPFSSDWFPRWKQTRDDEQAVSMVTLVPWRS